MASDEEVQEARQRVEDKRLKLLEAEQSRVAQATGLSNDITLAQLAREEAALDVQLNVAAADAESAESTSVLATIAERQEELAVVADAASPEVQRAHRQEAEADAAAAQAESAKGGK